MDYAVSRARLKNYFSTVTYIDDKFDHCIVDEPIDFGDEELVDTPPLPTFGFATPPVATVESETTPHTDEKDTEVNLSTILTALNDEKYAGVRFTPVLFKDNLEKDVLVKKIQESPLTLIDWNLGAKGKAFDFINLLFDTTKQLKVIVVYTSNYVEAIGAMQKDEHLKDCLEIPTAYSSFSCYRCNHQSLLIVAAKQSYNLGTILDIIPEVFIENCGLMPVALLDYMASAQHVSDELFGAFSHPFEDTYWLQMYFSELSEADIPSAISEFIQNKICEACSVAPQISDEMFVYHKHRLNALTEMDDASAEKVFHEALNALRPHLKAPNVFFCSALFEVDYTQIKDACTLAIKDSTTWAELLKIFASILEVASTIIVEQRVNSLLAPYAKLKIPEDLTEEINNHKDQVRENISKQVSIECECFVAEVFPVLVQILVSSPDILFAGAELVQNLKYHNYNDTDLNTILAGGKEMKKAEKESFLRNKFHYGDILIRDKKGTPTEYLLCISPPCDVCRPGKVKLNICFIKGLEIPEAELTVKRKENVHISVLPINDGAKTTLKYVAWRLFDIVKFDLGKKDDYESICSFSRPFMMSEQYSRQIGNLFTSYFSRAGVDELFMKSAQNLRAIFK